MQLRHSLIFPAGNPFPPQRCASTKGEEAENSYSMSFRPSGSPNDTMPVIMLLVLLLLLHATAKGTQNGHTPWILMHYHKSGHDLANNLYDVFAEKSCRNVPPTHTYAARRVDLRPFAEAIKKASISVVVPGALEDWQIFGPSKIVHFVRDPADMIISGYLYHSQVPPPPSEGWLHDTKNDMCAPNSELPKYIHLIQQYVGRDFNVSSAVNEAKTLCHKLKAQYATPTIYRTMKLADQKSMYEGIRVEAVRSLTAFMAGDLMHMTANTIWESRAPANTSHRVFMSDLPVGEREEATKTVNALIDYLMPSEDDPSAFWHGCITKQQAVDSCFAHLFVDPHKIANATSTSTSTHAATHITQGFVSGYLREHYKHKLLTDVHIGPLLRILQFVMLNTTTPAVTGADPWARR